MNNEEQIMMSVKVHKVWEEFIRYDQDQEEGIR